LRICSATAALCLLAACAGNSPPPEPQAGSALAAAAAPEPRRPGDATLPNGETLRQFYAGVEGDLITSGRMRQDVDPADAPFTTDDLVRDFVNIALKDEYVDRGGRYVQSETPSQLRRWERPVRMAVMNGPSSSPEDAGRNRANVAAFTSRLAHLTGHDIAMGKGADVNFVVLFMDSAERTQFADQVHAAYPDFAPAVIAALRDAPVNLFCITYAFFDPAAPSTYSSAIVLIRAEHPPFTRMSCVQEEMAQAMGLPNDSDEARPSLFNDTREFAFLTEHDAILLRMLYDPRLRPGMTAEEARPLLPAIAADARVAQLRDEQVVTVAAN
jgi:hypothetical protein